VGGNTTGGNCTVTLPNYGEWQVTVTYAGASSGSTATDVENIEAPPAPPTTTTTTNPPTTGAPTSTTTTSAPPPPTTTTTIAPPPPPAPVAVVSWSGWSDGSAYDQHGNGAAPDPLAASVGQNVNLFATTTGNLASDPTPTGTLDFEVSGAATVLGTSDFSGTCQAGDNYTGQAVDECAFIFPVAGSYTVSVSYVSTDANYASVSGPSATVVAS
jgi:hypothetical protein